MNINDNNNEIVVKDTSKETSKFSNVLLKLSECDPETRSTANSSVHSDTSKLSWRVKIFYSFGHVYNDLSVSMWFAYTLIFFKFQFSDTMAGALLLIGQLADAIFSPVVGMASDRCPNWRIFKILGRRKSWHLLGVIMTTISVPFVYNVCLGCQKGSELVRFLYYAFLVTVFQSGWAATQVAHVSLINDLTSTTNERLTLNAFRQAATVASNICMYTVTLFVFGFGDSSTLKEEDLYVFTYVAYIVCAIGIVFSIMFHIGVREPTITKKKKVKPETFVKERDLILKSSRGSTAEVTLLSMKSINEVDTQITNSTLSLVSDISGHSVNGSECSLAPRKRNKFTERKWFDWLRSLSFWKITVMYTMGRMFVNLTQVYTPLYLQDTLLMPKNTIAIIPFATYVSGFIFSFAAKSISARFGSRWILVIGSAFGIVTCVWIVFGAVDDESFKSWQIYIVSGCLGIGGTALLIGTLALTTDLIGSNTGTGAFVFASMSFVDKSFNGIIIELFQHFNPKIPDQFIGIEHAFYYKYIMIALTGVSSVAILIGLIMIIKSNYGVKIKKNLQNVIINGH